MTPAEVLVGQNVRGMVLLLDEAEQLVTALTEAGYAVLRDGLDDWTDPWLSPVIRWNVKPEHVCLCGHLDTAHNTDRVSRPCQTGGCGCTAWRHGHDVVRGHTERRVELEATP